MGGVVQTAHGAGTPAGQFGPLQVVDVEEVTFQSGDLRLTGDLFLPRHTERRPALVLVHGSGAQDRRGQNGYLRRMAEHFAGTGFAVLAYDKRGTGDSAGDWRTSGFTDLAADVGAAVSFLTAHRRVRPDAVGLVGFSQAGWVMPLAWQRHETLAFLVAVSAAGTGVTPAERHLFDMRNQAVAAGASPAPVADLTGAWDALLGAVRRGDIRDGSLDEAVRRARAHEVLGGLLPPSGAGIRWDRREQWFLALDVDCDALPLWRAITSPVLAVYGLEDRSFPVERVADRLLTEGLSHPASLVVTIPEAGHLLTNGSPTGPFAPGSLESIGEWLQQITGRGRR